MLCQGDEIICEINGQQIIGTICGRSINDQPIIGGVYIISPDESIMSDAYPFTHFAMPEINLTRKQIKKGNLKNKYQLLANKWKSQATKSSDEQEQAWLYACAADLESL